MKELPSLPCILCTDGHSEDVPLYLMFFIALVERKQILAKEREAADLKRKEEIELEDAFKKSKSKPIPKTVCLHYSWFCLASLVPSLSFPNTMCKSQQGDWARGYYTGPQWLALTTT